MQFRSSYQLLGLSVAASPVSLHIAQAAGAAFVAEARQALDTLFSIQPMPSADRIVVQKEHLGDRLAAHPLVQQQQFNQVATRCSRLRD
jgi:hypothetical protein